jgi:hypothetical protein
LGSASRPERAMAARASASVAKAAMRSAVGGVGFTVGLLCGGPSRQARGAAAVVRPVVVDRRAGLGDGVSSATLDVATESWVVATTEAETAQRAGMSRRYWVSRRNRS